MSKIRRTTPSMVDITAKPEVYREATARGQIKLNPNTIKLIKAGKIEKGDPLSTAKIAGTLAAKNTSYLIPLCHPLPITSVEIDTKTFNDMVEVKAIVKTTAKTGVEMEALVAATVALLTIWDMTKQYEKDEQGQYPSTSIENIRVVKKIKAEKK